MRGESPRDESGFLLVLCLQLFKHRRHRAGIVTGGIHILNAELVGFLFGAAAKLHEDSQQAKARRVLINHSGNATEKNRRAHRQVFQQSSFGLVFNCMTSANVSNLVSHHAGYFRFVVRHQQSSLC